MTSPSSIRILFAATALSLASGAVCAQTSLNLTNSGTLAGNLVIVDKNQTTSPSISREGAIYSTPIYKDGKLYLMMVNGEKLVYALDENGREFWSFSTEE